MGVKTTRITMKAKRGKKTIRRRGRHRRQPDARASVELQGGEGGPVVLQEAVAAGELYGHPGPARAPLLVRLPEVRQPEATFNLRSHIVRPPALLSTASRLESPSK